MGKSFVVNMTSERSVETGRNGTFEIKAIEIWHDNLLGLVWLDGISAARGITLNGGFRIAIEDMDKLCRAWADNRAMDALAGEKDDGLVQL